MRLAKGLIGLGVVALLSAPTVARADSSIPFADAMAQGTITFCDQAGHPITSGSVLEAPFAWSAHSSLAAPEGYAGAGEHATLVAAQPRQGLDPGNWSGGSLTSSSAYTDSAHPTVVMTPADDGLYQFLQGYPPQWGGLIQVRVALSITNEPAFFGSYAAAVLKISSDGSSWTQLNPGSASCSDGTATNSEVADGIVGAASTVARPLGAAVSSSAASTHPSGSTRTSPSQPTTGPGAASSEAPDSTPSAARSAAISSVSQSGDRPDASSGAAPVPTEPASTPSSVSATGHGSGSGPAVLIVTALLVVFAGGGAVLWRRRSTS